MSPRVFLGWFVVTVAAVVAALVIGLGRETATFDTLTREPVFAELRADPNAVARVEVASRFGEFTLVRQPDGTWFTPDRHDYPVKGSEVRRLVVGLSDMRYIERKTANPERFHRLELQDITEEMSDAAHVRLSTANGEVLADVIVGRPSARFLSGRSGGGTYIREPGTSNTWLVTGVTNVQTRLIPWLDREIVKIPVNEVASIRIGEGEGAYTLSRPEGEDQAFALTPMPEGRELDDNEVRRVSRALANLQLEDVAPRAEIPLPEEAHVASVTTYSGLTVTARLAEIDNKRWATFEASYTGTGGDESEAASAAREQAEAINARVGDWVYWVPRATFDHLTVDREKLLKEEQDPAS